MIAPAERSRADTRAYAMALALGSERGGVSTPNGAPLLAVCLTGQLRWHTLTLANLQHFVLGRLATAHRLY